jgi:signal transduction histidine kinase
LRLGPTELWRIADEAAEALAQLARERRLTLVRCPPDARLPIHGDPARLRQVVTNLLDNAVRHTPADGTVTLAAWRAGDRLVLTVSDTGEGMTPEELGMLFTPFRQVRPLTSGVGLGLGLALVRAIVEAHGGTVSADSPGPGQGSTFTVVLPCSEGEA